ncbi:RNA polymerase, sigma-24 subunit, RpoE [Roseibium suaedae]|uniref:RNA polymerase, sigma-24 subunit, RpoE n=1 Tax=Roseibium suaedae TaxID=735517 RepID=A0A1M7GT27_9HYPH|nr:RNA polymerase, sigma-24 subunit, RpoE [Roseibium suaedae]
MMRLAGPRIYSHREEARVFSAIENKACLGDREGFVTNRDEPENGALASAAGIWMSWIEDAVVLKRRALRLTRGNREDAEDLLSSTLVKAVAHVERHETEIREPRAFLLFAMKNEHISRMRRVQSERQVRDFGADIYVDHESSLSSNQPDQENLLRHQDTLRAVVHVVNALPPELRKVFRLRFCEEQSYRVIAEQLEISEPLARKRVQHLRERLRQALGEGEGCRLPESCMPEKSLKRLSRAAG